MKLLSYSHAGHAAWGAWIPADAQGYDIVDGTRATDGHYATLDAVIDACALDTVATALADSRPSVRASEIEWRLPLRPRKLLAVGGNYREHAQEIGMTAPAAPVFFSRFADSLVAPHAAIVRPRVSMQLDFEGELAVVIGNPGRHIAEADAARHIAGYTCFNDGSVRDFQKQSIEAGKNFHASGSLGPWIVTADDVDDPTRCELRTRVNGELMQQASTGELIHSVSALIAYASTFTPLAPGDVIATGTPAGIGARRTPPRWLRPGDVVEIDISGIGVLRNRVTDE
ncbi:fumarylacetoacetate hydrolase family protein [Caballeronia sp. LZ028]|uniref:fumarylacetoacetate hydrolase family protein n=1 Tax=Caballeronia sp. LZ028 TaxID=3038563 RepID=UPI00286614A2|nr:fumarylacetoacetate hydrolase family protein [Caballeronia sp. LZ028]MDR5770006.1 fumarylacetoacetate hydrolase family protein [Caballeronia sp. LZ028]